MSTFVRSIALLVIGLGCASCGKSEEDVREEFAEVVAGANACQQASECVLVSPGCPLACFVAVNSAKKAEVEEKARELVEDYESLGQSCEYDCAVPGPIECVAGRCDVKAASSP